MCVEAVKVFATPWASRQGVAQLNGGVPMNKKRIVVGVYGGLVQWMRGISEDIEVVVRDY